jgi:hypothetical protein
VFAGEKVKARERWGKTKKEESSCNMENCPKGFRGLESGLRVCKIDSPRPAASVVRASISMIQNQGATHTYCRHGHNLH